MLTEKELTPKELNEIDARSEKATQGPWKCERSTFSEEGSVLYELTGIESANINDARFIENSRQDVPALLAHIKYLEKKIRDLESQKSWIPLEYGMDDGGNISLPDGAPFDGTPVLILTDIGAVEAWWADGEWHENLEGKEYEGFSWVCYDDKFQIELDEVKYWMPLQAKPTEPDAKTF